MRRPRLVVVGSAYEFRILGPLEVVRDGSPLEFGPRRVRALLALLIVHANAVVSVDRIIDELWVTDPPEHAVHAVQVYVSVLRKVIDLAGLSSDAGSLIETRRPGYVLRASADDCDAFRFEALVDLGRSALATGDARVAQARLAEALGLWRGPALADLVQFPFAVGVAARLEELRIGAFEDRIEADLELGEGGAAVVAELESLVRAFPLRERLLSELMTGLYRAGRQVEALRAYQRFRRTLRDELGLEPSPELRRRETAIIRHEPVQPLSSGYVVAPGTTPRGSTERLDGRRRLPMPLALQDASGPFVGRGDELRALTEMWSASAGSVRLCLVTGEAGIGKSRLVAEFARRLQGAGAAVLYGACFEDVGLPYEPLIQALSLDLDELADVEARRRLGGDAGYLAAILPAVGVRFDVATPPPSANPDLQRLRLLDGVAGYLRRAAEDAPILLVVEDLHWGAVATLDLIRHIIRSGQGRVAVVATCRDRPPELTDPLGAFLADLVRHPNARRLPLIGLTTEEIAQLVGVDESEPTVSATDVARALHELTDGSPLFVKELLRYQPVSELLRPPLTLSPTLRDVVTARFAQFTADDQSVIDVATVLGAEFDAGLLSHVMDVSVDVVLDALERAEALGVVVDVPDSSGRFSFAHALLREVRYAQIPASRRLRLHQRAGHALASRHTDDAHSADLARHFCAAAVIGEVDRAVHYARRAGDVARSRFAFADAADFFERAEQAAGLASPPDAGVLCDLAIDRGEALHRGGNPAYREVLLGAAQLARKLGDPQRLAAAALALNEQGWTLGVGHLDDDVLAVSRAALDGLPCEPSRTRARLLAMMAAALNLTALHEQSRDFGTRAVATARQLNDRSTLAEVLVTAHWALFDPENLEKRLGIADEVEALSEQLDDPVLKLQALLLRAPDLREAGDVQEGNRVSRQAAALADELGLPFFRVLGRQGWAAEMAGRLDDAERQARDALARAADIGFDATAAIYPIVFSVLIDRGRWEELVEALPPLMSGTHGLPAYRAALAMVLARCDRLDDSRRHVERFTATDFTLMPRNIQWAAGMVALADAIAHLDHEDAAAALRPLLAPLSGRTPWQDNICMWPVDLALGQLAVVTGDHEASTRYLSAAEATCVRCETPIHLARCKVHLAWALTRAAPSGDPGRIRALLDDALGSARALGAHGVVREAALFGLVD
jgi:DNA-binding SARP family transcriptional activator/tetratricopeptide (TPR) repeat protein